VPPDAAGLDRFDQALKRIRDFTWLVFTSVNGVRAFWDRIRQQRIDIRNLAGVKIAAIGPATTAALARLGLRVDYQPDCYRSEELLAGLLSITGPADRMLLLRAESASLVLPSGLRQAQIAVTEIIAYRTLAQQQSADALERLLAQGEIDYLLFTSPSTVDRFWELLPRRQLASIKAKIACIGPVTAQAVSAKGLTATVVARVHTCEGLLQQILEYEREKHDA
jgi:uroporphyrinogen III methyltransferase/synthase